MTITLGHHDRDLADEAFAPIRAELLRLAGERSDRLRGERGPVPFRPLAPAAPMTVTALQRALTAAGFFPGGRDDGICGYRTRAAIRLFQEYVRSVERRPCLPDGVAGPKTMAELRRWTDGGLRASWTVRSPRGTDATTAESGEFDEWLRFVGALRDRLLDDPDPAFGHAERFARRSDTRPIAEWRTGADDIHLIGIRRAERDAARRFDDILVLLVRGLVFKFQGSTDPGHTSHPDGAPFLVPGQHDFRFGLHRGSYHALRPLHHDGGGVLVVRSKDDLLLSDRELLAAPEINGTINVHWGGKGVGRAVRRWSEGCQVVAGSAYLSPAAALIDCSAHVGINNTEVATVGSRKTRGAYDVLSDAIVAMSSDMPSPGIVRYLLVGERQLAIAPELAARIESERASAARLIARLG